MERAVAAKKPFYVNLWPDDVHGPWWPPVDKWAEGKRGLYLSVLEEMDRQFGKLFDFVRGSPELRENTLILICSDNGPESGAGSAGPFRGTKATLYEGGVRSPLVVWAPGLMAKGKAGLVNEASVFAAFDLAPSLLEFAGVSKPEGVVFDGEGLAGVLVGESEVSRKAPIFWRRPPDRKIVSPAQPERLPDLAMREGNWKLLCEYDGGRAQLYDLGEDAGEARNVAEQNGEVVERMRRAVVAWHRSMPADRGEVLGQEVGKGKGKKAGK
jgi:uncharacterized sulfatase